MNKTLAACGLMCAAVCLWSAEVKTGGMKASITDDSGKALPGAAVILTPVGQAGASYTAISGPAGEVSFTGIAPATYQVCVQSLATAHLDPCRWSVPTRVTVRAGEVLAASLPAIRKGSMLQVKLQDASQTNLQGAAKAGLRVGVITPAGVYHRLHEKPVSATESTLEIPIPFDTALHLSVSGGSLQLADAKGAAVGTQGATIPVQHPSGQTPAPVIVTISGKK